jgi:hypothetical protein
MGYPYLRILPSLEVRNRRTNLTLDFCKFALSSTIPTAEEKNEQNQNVRRIVRKSNKVVLFIRKIACESRQSSDGIHNFYTNP